MQLKDEIYFHMMEIQDEWKQLTKQDPSNFYLKGLYDGMEIFFSMVESREPSLMALREDNTLM